MEVVGKAVRVESPEATVGRGKRCSYRRVHFGQVDQTAHKSRLGNKLLQIGRHSGSGGENHGIGDSGRSKRQPREGTVYNGELHPLPFEPLYLFRKYSGCGGTRYQSLARQKHPCGEQPPQGGALVGEVEYLGNAASLQIVTLGGHEIHAVIQRHLGLGGGIDTVGLLAVHTYGGNGCRNAHLMQSPQHIVEAHRFAGVLLKPHDGEASSV